MDSAATWTTFQVDPHDLDNKNHVVHTLHSPDGDYQNSHDKAQFKTDALCHW